MNARLKQPGEKKRNHVDDFLAEMDAPEVEEVRGLMAGCDLSAIITDLHVWRVGKGKFACLLDIVTHGYMSADDF